MPTKTDAKNLYKSIQIAEEFPSVADLPEVLKIRHYEKISDIFWN